MRTNKLSTPPVRKIEAEQYSFGYEPEPPIGSKSDLKSTSRSALLATAEATAQRQDWYPSLDRFAFRCRIPLDPALTTDPKATAEALGFPDLSIISGISKRTERWYIIVHLLPDNALTLHADQQSDGSYLIKKISGNASAILRGHNGAPANNESDLTAFLCRTKELASRCVPRNFHDQIIPGEPKSKSHWVSLEIYVHVADPDGRVFQRVVNMRHRLIRKGAQVYRGETVSLKGTNRSFTAYRKDLEMQRELNRFNATADPILRFELKLSGDMLPAYFPESCKQGDKVVSFTLGDLREAYLRFTRCIEGIQGTSSASECPPVGRFIAEVAQRYGAPIEELIRLYATEKALKSTAKLRSEAARHFATLGETDPSDLFNDEALMRQPAIVIPALEDAVGNMVERFAFSQPAITRAYTEHGRRGEFTPRPNL